MSDLASHLEEIARAQGGGEGEWEIELAELVIALRERGYHVGSVEFLVDDIVRLGEKATWDVEYDHSHKRLVFRG